MKTVLASTLIVVLMILFVSMNAEAAQPKERQSRSRLLARDIRSLHQKMSVGKAAGSVESIRGNRNPISRSLHRMLSLSTTSTYDDGTLDSTFGTYGSTRFSINQGAGVFDEATAVVVQSDGKIVAGGYAIDASFSFEGFAIARLDANGTLDNTFGSGGTVLTQINGGSGSDLCYAVALQPDGKIVAAGVSMLVVGPDTTFAFAVARFDSDGTLDNTFGSGGTARTSITGGGINDAGLSVAIQPGGKIVVGGFSEDASGNIAFALAQFNSDGSLDTDFGTSGTTRAFISGSGGTDDECSSIVLQPDGKIIAAGYSADVSSNWAFAVARFTSNGSPDATFGSSGSVTTFINGSSDFDDVANAVVLQPNGKIVAAGRSADADTNHTFALARFDSTGTVDNTFGTNGTLRASINGGDLTNDEGTAAVLQPDGNIVVAGYSDSLGYTGFAVARFLADGTPDNSFGPGGSIRTYIGEGGGNIFDKATAVALQSNGNIIAAGYSSDVSFFIAFAVLRLTGSSEVPLPVELTNFAAAITINSATLTWKTITETNNYGFAIERRSIHTSFINDVDTSWMSICFVKGSGTSAGVHTYSYTDANLPPGVYGYRLKQIDNNGTFKYSSETEVTVALPTKFGLYQNYPNPFNPATTISFDIPARLSVSLKIFDILGREMATLIDNEEMAAGLHAVQWNASSYASGLYFYRIQAGSFTAVKKLILLR